MPVGGRCSPNGDTGFAAKVIQEETDEIAESEDKTSEEGIQQLQHTSSGPLDRSGCSTTISLIGLLVGVS